MTTDEKATFAPHRCYKSSSAAHHRVHATS